MVFLTWEEAVDLAEAVHERYRALVYLAVDSGMRWSELVGLQRRSVELRRGKVRVTEQLIRFGGGGVAAKGAQDAVVGAVHHDLAGDCRDPREFALACIDANPVVGAGIVSDHPKPVEFLDRLAASLPQAARHLSDLVS